MYGNTILELYMLSRFGECLSISKRLQSLYNVGQKTRHPTHVDNFAKNWSIFKILSLVDSEQNLLKNNYYIAHHTLQMLLHYLVKLQCFKKSYKFKNTSLKDVVLKYFCGCTCLISFSRQIRVSIQNYEISVRIKYSVRDLINDIHICAWAAMTQ